MTKTVAQRREARLASVQDQRREDAELDLPLLTQAIRLVEGDLAKVREKLAAIMPQLINSNSLAAQQIDTLALLEKNLVQLLTPMIDAANAVLAPPADAPPADA